MNRNIAIIIITSILILEFSACKSSNSTSKNDKKVAGKPLYQDTIYDGAADPTVIYNYLKKSWFMFYTNRRANQIDTTSINVSWVHGTPIGIAESTDNGITWHYVQDAAFNFGDDSTTFWAPEVIYYQGVYHMYLTVVPGIFNDWNHPRHIVHCKSMDLVNWEYVSELELASEKVIDACVFQVSDTLWRLWYNNEKDGKTTYFAESNDLHRWKDKGKAKLLGKQPGEGPDVFMLNNTYYMIIDEWKGLGIFHSKDALTWERQPDRILDIPGTREQDNVIGHHADVLINDNEAYIFYFTHPGRNNLKNSPYEKARSVIQIAQLAFRNEQIVCERNNDVYIHLSEPKK